jgi:hypothetical protein
MCGFCSSCLGFYHHSGKQDHADVAGRLLSVHFLHDYSQPAAEPSGISNHSYLQRLFGTSVPRLLLQDILFNSLSLKNENLIKIK